MVVLQKCVDLGKLEPSLCSETCHTSFGDSNQVAGIKVEEYISTEDEEDPEPVTGHIIKTEDEVICTFLCPLLSTFYGYWELPSVFLISVFLSFLYIKCLNLENGF